MGAERHVFVSDVHLVPGGDETTERFIRFLESLDHRVSALHVLGDLFHYWLGRGHERRPDYAAVLQGFRSLADRGVPINLIWGNRDFMVQGRAFERQTGIRLRGDQYRFRIGQRKVKVVHGDLLCANDVRYQYYRRIIRSGPIQTLARILSLELKRMVADGLRRMSESEVKRKSMRVMDLDEKAVRRLFADGTELVVCGHIHREQLQQVALPERQGQLYVLGSWDREAPFLIGEEQGDFEFARDALEVN